MTFYCPLCDYEAKTLNNLKKHFRVAHVECFTRCPLCEVDVYVPKHAWQIEDVDHMVLYYLTANTRTRSNKFKRARGVAYEVLKDPNYKW